LPRRLGGNVFFVIRKHRDSAEYFARRKAQQENDRPALVTAVVEDVEFQSLRKNGHAVLLPFDEQDAPALRGRNQWVVTAAGIEILNARWLDISYEEVLPTTAGQS